MAITIDGTNGLTTDSGALKLDGTTLTIDETNNRVGIGTASPNSQLEIVDSANDAKLKVTTTGANRASLIDLTGTIAGYNWIQSDTNGTSDWRIGGGATTSTLTFATGASFTERMRLDSSGNLLFNSGYGSVATAYGCRAWAKFQGSGTVGLSQGGNVSTVGDNGTGDYTVNFSTAMPDVDYCAVTSGHENIGTYTRDLVPAGNYGTTSVRVRVYGGLYDISVANVAIFR